MRWSHFFSKEKQAMEDLNFALERKT